MPAPPPDGQLHPLVVALIARALQRLAPALVPSSFDFDDLLAAEAVPESQKLELLRSAHALGGGSLVLQIGRVLHDPQLPPQPILFLLKNTGSVAELLGKCEQIWPSLNSRNRVRVELLEEQHAVVSYSSLEGQPPSVVESLHICGLAIGMLEFLGVRGLEVRLLQEGSTCTVYHEGCYLEPAPGPGHRWEFRWRAFVPRDRLEGLDEYLLATAKLKPLPDASDVAHRLRLLVQRAPAKRWTLRGAARELGLSERSLQRTLAQSDTSFRNLLWSARVSLAEELLLRDTLSATEIAHQLGFADSSHFSRRFLRGTGLSPAEFRRRRPAAREQV